jgi:hypothetical protein
MLPHVRCPANADPPTSANADPSVPMSTGPQAPVNAAPADPANTSLPTADHEAFLSDTHIRHERGTPSVMLCRKET